jgi:CRP/FNR family cyclic AMP-dependent transcriptional regulator
MLDENNCFDRLIYNDWFALFPYHIRSQLFNKSEARTALAGEHVFLKGEEGGWLAALMSGRVRISLRSFDGREMLISMVERGEICGERAVFDGNLRSGDAIAEVDTAYLVFRRDDLLPALYSCPDALMYIVRIMCNRTVRYMNTMELYAMQNLPIRLANFLLFLGQKYGKPTDNGHLELQFSLSQTDLSRQIASSRESINRQMKQFAALGLIDMDGDGIVLTDVPGLERICHST